MALLLEPNCSPAYQDPRAVRPGILRRARQRGVTLVEAMVSLTVFATVMLAFVGTFMQSRRLSESSVLHAAASSLIYGIIEQIKGLEYTTALPSTENDVNPDNTSVIWGEAPFVRVRINQDKTVWIRVVHTPASQTPKGPTATPAPGVKPSGAIDNFLGDIPLSTVTGTTSQDLSLNIWAWIDDLAEHNDATEVKKITLIYTYSFMDGGKERIIVDREVFLRTRFDQ